MEKVGFFGILACASVRSLSFKFPEKSFVNFVFQIPNPLFDLAGITCGHFLVPFWTFFGATVIGKAVIKMHIQKFFVIMAFNENLISTAVAYLSELPYVGKKLEEPFKELLRKQKEKLHQKSGSAAASSVRTDFLIFRNAFYCIFEFSTFRTRACLAGSLKSLC